MIHLGGETAGSDTTKQPPEILNYCGYLVGKGPITNILTGHEPYMGTPPQRARCRAPGARLRAPSDYGPQEAPTLERFTAVVPKSSQLQYIPTTAPGATLGLGVLAIVEAARLKSSTAQPAPARKGSDHCLHSYRRHPLGAMTGPSYLTGGEGPVWAILLRSRPTGPPPTAHHTYTAFMRPFI
jgi:hypothetical protein